MTNYCYPILGFNFVFGEMVNGLTILLQYESQSNTLASRTDGIIIAKKTYSQESNTDSSRTLELYSCDERT